MYEATETRQNPLLAPAYPKALILFSLLTTIAAVALNLFTRIFMLISVNFPAETLMSTLPNYITTDIEKALIAFILPGAALLIGKGGNHGRAKKFIPVTIIVLAIQLLSALVMAIVTIANGSYNGFTRILMAVSGSETLSYMVNFFRRLSHMNFSNFHSFAALIQMFFGILTGACFIVKNVFSLFSFIKLSRSE